MESLLAVAVTSFMQGNFFSLSSPEGGGTARPHRGSRDSASRNRFSVGPFSLIAAPCSSSMASESEWDRVEEAGIGVDARGRADLGEASWGENTPVWLAFPSVPSTRRVVSSLCNCKIKTQPSKRDVFKPLTLCEHHQRPAPPGRILRTVYYIQPTMDV